MLEAVEEQAIRLPYVEKIVVSAVLRRGEYSEVHHSKKATAHTISLLGFSYTQRPEAQQQQQHIPTRR
jgi:hypothetical protein